MLTVRPPPPSDLLATEPASRPAPAASSQADVLALVLADLAVHDSDVLLAAEEVDRSLIRLTLALSPLERVRTSAAAAATLDRLRRARG
jgi:hypothetical protein